MKKLQLHRVFSFLLAFFMVLSMVPVPTWAESFDTVNFKGLVIEAESNVSITVYRNHGNAAENMLTPDYVETIDGITSYYFTGLSGACRYDAKRAGDYTIYGLLYMSPAEAATRTVERVKMEPRAGEWDHSYYYAHPDELMYTIEDDPNQKWKTEVALDTPVFTKEDKASQQMTTQPEMVEFIDALDDAKDNMYVFSIGTSSKYNFDIPIAIFTKTDLSSATTLEEAAALLAADGLPNMGYKAQTHGDEHASCEGALAVMKLLDGSRGDALLNTINIYVIPRLNPDGAYDCKRNLSVMLDPSLDNRDPDRDLMDMNSKEMRQYMYATELLQPVMELDGHERGHGSDIGEIQLGIAWKPIESQELLDVQVDMMYAACADLKDMDLSGAWYTDIMNAASSRNNRGYGTYIGRIQILMESRGIYMGTEAYGSRTACHVVSAMSFLEYAAENATTLEGLVTAERERIITEGAVYDEEDLIILSSGKTTHPEYAIETEDYNTLSGSVKWVEKIPELYDQILRSRVAPTAYVLSADLPKIDSILDQMDAQFIRYTKLPNNAAVTLQQYYGTTTEAFLTEEKTVVFPNGAYVFTMDQAKGEILALLMEPDVTDLETYKNNLTFQEKIPQDAYGYFGSYRYIHDLEDGQIAYTVAPAAPEGLAATEATYGNTDGRITGLNTAKLYEYRKAGEESYIKVSAGTTEITGLTAGTYYVRYQASGNTLYSADVTLTVECDQLVFVSTAGKDSNAGTEDAPVKTLSGAYSKLPQGGTVVFMDDLSLTGNTIFPVSTYPVTLTSKTGAEGIVTTGSLRMQGNTTFENITVTFNATGLAFISGEGYDLTIGENVTTVNKTGNQVNLVATKRFDAALSANPTLTVKSGTWDFIYATHGNSLTGNVTVNIEGGSCTTVSPSYNATVTGDVNISIKNATVKSLCLEPTHKNGVITGKLHITMGDDADIAASSGSSGVVQGGTTLELVGDVANLGTMTGYGAGSKLLLTSGTWKGTAAEFGQVSLEIAEGKTVTLSSPITADTVTCDGTLDFEGVGSLVAKAITGTVNCTITGRVLKNNLYASVPADADIRFPAEYGMQNDNGNYMIYDLVNFEGLVVKADKAVKVTFYSDAINNNTTYHGRKDYVIQPYATTEENGVVSYYLPNITGLYCYEVSQSGYYTVFNQVYMTEEEAAACTVEQVVMEKRDGKWDLSYYFSQTDEIMDAMEPETDKWQTEVPLVTPVFTKEDKAAHQMTTQPELEAFIQDLDDAGDNMYIFSIGKSATYNLDIPIVIFTKADLSGATTLEQAAELLKKSGIPNVGYKAQMHGDEHAAGEGALGVIRLLDQAENAYLLDSINIFVIPRMNPDGGYVDQRNLITKIDTSLTNLDPNRDMLSLNLLEQRHYLKAIQLLDPIAELDGHERQRNSFVGDIQISMSWQPDSSQALFDIQEEMLQSIFGALEAVDLSGAWYSDYVNTDGVDQTRGYAGNQGRIQFLMETRGIYMGNEAYGSRTASHIVTAMEYLRLCAENAQQILQIVTAEREHIAKAGETYEDTDTITLSYGSVAVPELDMLTDHYSLQGGEVKTQKAKLYVVNKTRVAPTAYVIPANLPKIAVILELMELQEIDYYFLPANTAIPVQQYSGTVDADRVTTNVALTEEQYVVFPDGAYVLQMNQANGKNLAYLMEPDSPSNADLVQQGRIAVDSNGNFPIYRYIRDLKQDSIGVDYVQAQSAPQNIQVVDAGVAANDGMITGLDGEKLYEYKASGADSYTKLPAGTTQITGLTPDTYYLRYQADFYGVPGQTIVCTIGCNVTVYVSSAGSDTGAGTTEATALKTLEAAYTKLADILGDSGDASRGTIILLNDYTITSDARVDMPSHTFPVSILGKTATVKLIFKPTVISESTQQLAFHGPTTLDNLELRGESTSKLDYIYACGNPFTIGANLTTSARSSMPILVAGDYRAAAEDTDMTVLGGTWYGVYAGSFRAGHTGTAKLTINGAKIDNFIRGKYTGATTGNIEVILENTNFTKFNIGYNGDMSGTTKVTLRQGAVGTVFTNNGNSGNITGTVTVVMDGANREQVVFENTSATVTKDVLVFASGYATRETGFSEIHIITEDTVTLAEDMTVDYIAGGGTVELNGYHLAGEGAYGMDAAVTSVSLRPNVAGLYYSGNFRVSDALAGAAYGIALSTEDETPVAQEQTTSLYTVGATSVLVKDIMKAGSSENKQNATTRVYARAYVKLADGTTIYSNTVKVTLRQLVVAVDAKWDALTDVQKQGLKALYETFATDMANWNIPNMKKA